MKILVLDTETTGLFKHRPHKPECKVYYDCETKKWPKIIQLSYILFDTTTNKLLYKTKQNDDYIKINTKIPKKSQKIHHITNKILSKYGKSIVTSIDQFMDYYNSADLMVGYFVYSDINFISAEIDRIIHNYDSISEPKKPKKEYEDFLNKFKLTKDGHLREKQFCIKSEIMRRMGIFSDDKEGEFYYGVGLAHAHNLLFGERVSGHLHNSIVDVIVTLRIYLKLIENMDICLDQDLCSMILPHKKTRRLLKKHQLNSHTRRHKP